MVLMIRKHGILLFENKKAVNKCDILDNEKPIERRRFHGEITPTPTPTSQSRYLYAYTYIYIYMYL